MFHYLISSWQNPAGSPPVQTVSSPGGSNGDSPGVMQTVMDSMISVSSGASQVYANVADVEEPAEQEPVFESRLSMLIPLIDKKKNEGLSKSQAINQIAQENIAAEQEDENEENRASAALCRNVGRKFQTLSSQYPKLGVLLQTLLCLVSLLCCSYTCLACIGSCIFPLAAFYETVHLYWNGCSHYMTLQKWLLFPQVLPWCCSLLGCCAMQLDPEWALSAFRFSCRGAMMLIVNTVSLPLYLYINGLASEAEKQQGCGRHLPTFMYWYSLWCITGMIVN